MRSQNESKKFSIIDSAVLKSSLRPTTKLVYAAIASFYRGNNSLIFPSYNRIADMLGINRRTAISAVAELVACGLLQKAPQMRSDGGFTSNLYTLTPSDLNSLPPSDLNNTSPSDLNNTSPSDLNSPRIISNKKKNNLFKINNTRAQGAQNVTGEMLRTPESPEQKNKDSAILEIFSLSKCRGWVELVRIQQQYCLRPVSDKVFSYINEQDFEDLRAKIAEKAGSCRGLKYGQHNEMEVIIK